MKVFDSVPIKIPAKNVFDLSHDVKSSYNFDKIYPFLCQPVYPGDTWNCRAEVFMRAMPLLAPVMHNVDLRVYFFFVPNRLDWNENRKRDWKTFITGGEDGMQNPVLPYFTYKDLADVNRDFIKSGSLLDHMGFATDDSNNAILNGNIRVCSLPFRAYQLVYNEYFRNQNVQNEVEFSFDEGEETSASIAQLFEFRKKCWEKDYFTSCLPFQQRGEAVRLPIDYDPEAGGSTNVPVTIATGRKVGTTLASQLVAYAVTASNQRAAVGISNQSSDVLSAGDAIELKGTATVNGAELAFTGLSIGTINDFRYCLRLQQWLENNARCGSRYIEQLLAHFGVTSSDARLQRPELLGGGKIPLLFTDVEQTSYGQGTSDDVLGDLGGKGTLYGKTSGFKKYFEEHGILLGLLTIVPRTSYCQGLPRVWTAFDKTDWYFPEFANLGEQAVLNKEVYYNPTAVSEMDKGPDDVFGYQGRFTELRYIPSSIHGEMKNTLQYWHFGRIFPSQPSLNSTFVEAQTSARVWALDDVAQSGYDPFVAQIHLDIKAVRPLPKYAVPTL